MRNSLIIYSGGMDSSCLLYDYKDSIALAITYNYGSKHNEIEYQYAKRNTEQLDIEHLRIDLTNTFQHFKSDLLKSGGEIPEGHYEDESMKKTVVPFRNGIMLSIAAGIAESRGLKRVLIANHAGDHVIYPDCREDFIDAMNEAVSEGTDKKVQIIAPYTILDKRGIAMIGQRKNVPFYHTYSCYKGGPIHCGKCGTCVERKEALQGFDSTQYLS